MDKKQYDIKHITFFPYLYSVKVFTFQVNEPSFKKKKSIYEKLKYLPVLAC